MGRRHAGVLLHPSSLPGPGPIGEIGPYALAFLDWMVQAGLDVWQMLPLHPVGPGNSPYASPSAFAADTRLISVEDLVGEGLLDPSPVPWGVDAIDPEQVVAWKLPLLRAAAAKVAKDPECRAWVRAQPWMKAWARFASLQHVHGGGWWDWPDERAPAEEIAIQGGLQYLFHRQWTRLRAAATRRGIHLVGDIPIFVDADGCDTWSDRSLFRLREDGRPDPVSGVPPDYFSPSGQRWGNPVYDWARHEKDNFAWWRARLARELELVDAVRLDHFRGFVANWCIPAAEEDARTGHWEPGPGRALFEALREGLGRLPVVAEDLGDITEDVEALRETLGLPGMKVLQFAFGGDAHHPFLPHNYVGTRWVAYTGTHDNDTVAGWYAATDETVRHRVRTYCGRDGSAPAWALLREAWASVAEMAVAPMQDLLGLGSDARMNTPGVAEGNWVWRLRDLPWNVCGMVRNLGETFGRAAAVD